MQLTLEAFRRLPGVGAASGLCLANGWIYLISDNATFLYGHSLEGEEMVQIPLAAKPEAEIGKKHKPDFEALLMRDGHLEVYGSGSRPNRQTKAVVDPNRHTVEYEDLTPLYERMQAVSGIDPDAFNIEGVVSKGNGLYFFQRGNGAGGHNGIFSVSGSTLSYHPIALPAIDGTAATFTDATLVDDTIYFLAAAEASDSTYYDGEVTGSLIGTWNPDTDATVVLGVLPGKYKFEGLAFEARTSDGMSFLLCEDEDVAAPFTTLYRLVIST
ncbi:MAG TPA: hypothetical protein VK183_13560 [Flavobacterium sp.]|nr:hypothetical protein [Flavobacterium sp.]